MAGQRGGKKGNDGSKGFRNPHNLPVKECVVCNRPFTWRKKWENCWDEVLTCSNRCKSERRAKKKAGQQAAQAGGEAGEDDGAEDSEDSGESAAGGASGPAACAAAALGGAVGASSRRPVALSAEPEGEHEAEGDAPADARHAHRQAVKAQKALRRKQRAGSPEAAAEKKKPCDLCGKNVNLLVRCQCDASRAWRMACGRCWKEVSGGVPDGDADHPHYRYGGLWKNRSAAKTSMPKFGKAPIDAEGAASASEEELSELSPAALGA